MTIEKQIITETCQQVCGSHRGGVWVTAAAEKPATVYVYGVIGGGAYNRVSEEGQAAVAAIAQIDAQEIRVRINSAGGTVADGIALHNAFRQHPARVITQIDGIAYSMASYVLQSGDWRIAPKNSQTMIHGPHAAGESMSAPEHRDLADWLDQTADQMAEIYANPKLPINRAREMVSGREDHYLTGEEAFAMGLVDEVVDPVDLPSAWAVAREGMTAGDIQHIESVLQEDIPMEDTSTTEEGREEQAPVVEQQAQALPPAAEETPPNVAEIRADVGAEMSAAYKARAQEIRAAFAEVKDLGDFSGLEAECLADPEVTADIARKRILQAIGKNTASVGGESSVRAHVITDESDKRKNAIVEAMAMRVGAAEQDRSNPYRGSTLIDVAAMCLERNGIQTRGYSRDEIATLAMQMPRQFGAQTTDNFPVLLEETQNKMLLTGYRQAPVIHPQIAKQSDASNFYQQRRIVPGLMGNLDTVNENGEYDYKPIPDGEKQNNQVVQRGNILSVSLQSLVNDDLGGIADQASAAGNMTARAVDRAVVSVLETNALLTDGVALFAAGHSNLAASGAAPTAALIDSAGSAIASQAAPGDDAEPLDIMASIVLVPRALQGQTSSLVDAEYDPDDVGAMAPNPIRGQYRVVSSARLAANVWYTMADPGVTPALEVVYLNGQREPRLTQVPNNRTGGLYWVIEFHFGAAAIDYRPIYKNPGA